MVPLLSDHNFNGRILRGLGRRVPELDLVRALDIELAEADDPTLLERAAGDNPILLTHDVNTVPGFANARVQAGLPMAGVFLVPADMPIGQAIDDLSLACSVLYRRRMQGFGDLFSSPVISRVQYPLAFRVRWILSTTGRRERET